MSWAARVLFVVFVLGLIVGAPKFVSAYGATLELWHPFGDGTMFDALEQEIKHFNDEQDEIYVELVHQADQTAAQYDKLITAIAVGAPPDLAIIDRFTTASWVERGGLMALDQLGNQIGLRREDFFPATWDESVYKGQLWAVPLQTNTRVLYYNKTLFLESGLDSQRPPETWDELDQFALRLTSRQGDNYERFGFIPWIGQGHLYTYGFLAGGAFYDPETEQVTPDHPRIVDALEWMHSYATRYGAPATVRAAMGNVNNAFWNNRLAMLTQAGGFLSQTRGRAPDLDLGVARLPYPQGGEPGGWLGGFGLVIPRGAKQRVEAGKVIAYLASPESQLRFALTASQLPPRIAAAIDPSITGDSHVQVLLNDLPDAKHRPPIPVGDRYWTELYTARDAALNGTMPAAAALQQTRDLIQAELNQYLSKN